MPLYTCPCCSPYKHSLILYPFAGHKILLNLRHINILTAYSKWYPSIYMTKRLFYTCLYNTD